MTKGKVCCVLCGEGVRSWAYFIEGWKEEKLIGSWVQRHMWSSLKFVSFQREQKLWCWESMSMFCECLVMKVMGFCGWRQSLLHLKLKFWVLSLLSSLECGVFNNSQIRIRPLILIKTHFSILWVMTKIKLNKPINALFFS